MSVTETVMSVTELIGGAIGFTLVGLGGASMLAWNLRRRPTDRVLFLFGLWTGLYGARLVAEQPSIAAIIGGPTPVWTYVVAFITYVINVPIGLFLEALIGPGWKQSVRRVWQAQAVYAVGAIATEIVLGRPRAAMGLNSPIVLIGLVIGLANLWMFRHRLSGVFKSPAIAVGAITLLLFVINENVGRPVVPDINLEPLGLFAFVASLGYGVVGTAFRQEAELVAVQRELETARRIQTALLPRVLPQVSGLDVAVRYLPMTAVAGDLYDFMDLGPSHVGILVADVCGHGIPAAMVASMVKLAFSAQAEHADHAHDPARVLSAINRILCRHVDGTFVTAIYAVIDTDRRTITVANAGHPPLLLGRSNSRIVESAERGMVLGVFPDAPYANAHLALEPGDSVLVYTDGIPETQDPHGDFLDLERVKGWLASINGHDAAQFADSALSKLRQWRGGTAFEDDLTLVVARFTGSR
jgi:sigma-B regulation protein RsbU (phosphoserine phosphatase)